MSDLQIQAEEAIAVEPHVGTTRRRWRVVSAARLREAATVLRERAKAAKLPPKNRLPGMVDPDLLNDAEYADAAYIITMHPGVALALADWLDFTGKRCCAIPPAHERLAIATADAILGGESHG